MGKVSNVTNRSDPEAIQSRVFIGNLNTFALNKDYVRTIFEQYGSIVGISLHKGYAFVQYTNPESARSAVASEDQSVHAGQQIDVNLSAEPKSDRKDRRRSVESKEPWSVLSIPSAFTISLGKHCQTSPNGTPSMGLQVSESCKASILEIAMNRFRSYPYKSVGKASSKKLSSQRTRNEILRASLGTKGCNLKTNSTNNDIVICGKCKEYFQTAEDLLAHKVIGCRLKFVCKCRQYPGETGSEEPDIRKPDTEEPKTMEPDTALHKEIEQTTYTCATCRSDFQSCLDLCHHCEMHHGLNILFQISSETDK